LNIPFLEFHLGSQRKGTERTQIFVFVPIWEDEEETFPHGNRLPASGAK
jgi:hypothetical protein